MKIAEIMPLTPLQEGLLYASTLSDSGPDPYTVQADLGIDGDLDPRLLHRSAQAVLERHPNLRTAFRRRKNGMPVALVLDGAEIGWAEYDLTDMSETDALRRWHELRDRDRDNRFDPGTPPLLRLTLARIAPRSWRVLITNHHLILDGWSSPLLVRDIFAAYAAGGDTGDLPPVRSYRDFLAWLNDRDTGAALNRWRQVLGATPSATLLAPDTAATLGSRPAELRIDDLGDLTDRLTARARAEGTTTAALVQTAWGLTLGLDTGRGDVLFGITVSGRSPDFDGAESIVGMTLGAVPVRVEAHPWDQLTDVVRRVGAAQTAVMDDQWVGLPAIAGAVGLGEMFDTLLVFENHPLSAGTLGETMTAAGLAITTIEPQDSTHYPLTLQVIPHPTMQIRLHYLPEAVSVARRDRLARTLVAVLTALADAPSTPVAGLPVLDEREAARVRALGTGAALAAPSLDDLLSVAPGDEVAVIAAGDSITWTELDARVRALTQRLADAGIGPESIVALALARRTDTVTAVLAILRSGAAILPVALDYPTDFITFVLGDARPDLVVVDGRTPVPGTDGLSLLVVGDAAPGNPVTRRPAGERTARPDNLAYLLYTSGSTGTPKAVAGTRAGLAARLAWAREQWPPAGPDVRLVKSSLSFIDGLTELLGAVTARAPMIVATDDERLDPIAQAALITEHAVTQVTAVGSLAAELAESAPAACRGITRWILSGETLHSEVAARLRELAPGTTIVNSYGSSEVVGDVTFAVADPETADPVPIGRPVPGTEILVLDDALRPAPVGVVGEIYVRSAQVARGYLRRPALTAERFVAAPDGDGRLFRTGDTGCWDGDGNLEFHGRADGQVKIRGHRVETVGVEAALRAQPGVDDAVVVARPDSTGSLTLWAYVTGDADPIAVRAAVAERLPDYQVPAVRTLDQLPTLPNGKVDRRSLPDPAGPATGHGVRPLAPGTETSIAALFGDLLGRTEVDAELNFFVSGGHSLLATRLAHRIALELETPATVRTVFDHPTVATLAAWVDEYTGEPDEPDVADLPRPDPLPATSAQRRLWALDRLRRDSPHTGQGQTGHGQAEQGNDAVGSAYNLAFVVELDGPLDPAALRSAAQTLVDRHESLRTRLVADDDGNLFQQILPVGTGASVTEHDGPEYVAALERSRNKRFDLAAESPFRLDIAHTGDHRSTVQIVMHHIAGDEWSTPLVFGELAAEYERVLGDGAPPPAPALQYADAALRQERLLDATDSSGIPLRQHERDHWRRELDGLPDELPLPYDRPRPAFGSDSGGTVEFTIDAPTTDALARLTRTLGVTGFMVVHAAVAALWSRLTGGDDIALGTPVAGREDPATRSVIGMFTNTVVLRTRLNGDPTVADLLEQVRQVDLTALEHQLLPFQEVVDAVDPARDVARSPLFQTLVQYRSPISTPDFAGIPARLLPAQATTAKFDLTVEFLENGPGQPLSGRIEFARDLFDEATVQRIAAALTRVLTAMVADPGTRLSRLPLLTDPDRAALIGFNDTAADVPTDADLPILIVRAAHAHPGTPAVIDDDTTLTYSELLRAADNLARRLAGSGVGTDDVVGVDLPRGVALSVSVLAIMRAGAAYLPLDRDHPPARREFILGDARPAAIVTDDDTFAAADAPIVRVDATGTPVTDGPDKTPPPGSLPVARGAYLIYTSGSTGNPKAVVVEHPAIVNRLLWMQARFGLRPGERVLHKTPIGFDVSVWELFWPLICGATIVMAAPGAHREPAAIAEALRRHRITTVHFVPSLLRAFLADTTAGAGEATGELPDLPDLRRILCSGEALTAPLRDGVAQRFAQVRLHNLYGPTEAAVDVTEIDVTETTGTIVPIGAPVWNTGLHVLGRTLDELPIGAWGELYLSGRQLARGYARRAGLTSTRFLACPFGSAGDRMYRTGDVARWTADGVLEYAGRSDGQLKLRGQRVEPGEIERALLSTGHLAQAVVVGHTTVDGRTALVAYGVPSAAQPGDTQTCDTQDPNTQTIAPEQILADIAELLPAHLVPATLTLLDALPVTANGKLDARRLPDPLIAGLGGAVEDPMAAEIAGVFADVLHLDGDAVGSGDDFFALGGDSIVAITVVNRLRRRGLLVDVRELFEQRTVAALAAVVRRDTKTASDDVPERTSPLPLTPIVAQLAGRPGRWQSLAQSITVAVPATVTADDIRRALDAVIARHEALRLRVTSTVPGVWSVQPVAVQSFDTTDILTVHQITDPTPEAFARIAADTHARLDPTTHGTITAAAVFADGEHVRLVLVIHHLAVDAVSWRILLDDLADAADAVAADVDAADKPPALPSPAVPYSRYADAMSELAAAPSTMAELTRWRTLLARSVPITDARDFGVQADLITTAITLDEEHTRRYLSAESVTAAVIADSGSAITAWRTGAGHTAGPVLIDVERHGRDLGDLDLSRTVGWLTTVTPVLFDPAGDDPAASDPAASDPAGPIADELGRPGHSYGLLRHCNARTARALARAPRAQVLVNYLGIMVLSGGGRWQPAPESAWTRTRPADDLGADYAITVDARVERDRDDRGRLVVEVTCSARVFTPTDIEVLVGAVEQAVRARAGRGARQQPNSV
ncbi:amino acid adenylation domain-containing protein [Gordonia pseudamarae]|uniref:Amino acid adenylation domain-containing protein n=1 Tax=Gordonia pseudamarae TaxID=2831662 RepID=A0ABX6IFR2_9ACTN|nr:MULTISPECIES: non-ribosomal peptide synthetase [Gordonia]MBD0020376.1 amino acid adenylation domain-containing protein [Gordonia sp. (in: high G+C Gram-positive bacteria)]QHN25764.1 amino acid adenylation domain-containing protein [Gordonia pseudamarae]QHN34695.1 amino acid adenylation domain-containing protein [Gordonia pseudamarae]